MDTGVRVFELDLLLKAVTDPLIRGLRGVVSGLTEVRSEASQRIAHSGIQDLSAHMGQLGSAAVLAGQQNVSASAQVADAWDKVAASREKGEEQVRQAQLRTMKLTEELLDKQHRAHASYNKAMSDEYKQAQERMLLDLKVAAAQRKAVWDQEDRELKERQRSAQQAIRGRAIQLTPAETEQARFGLWGATSPSGRANAQFGMNTGDAIHQQQQLDEALRQGQLIQIQTNARLFDEAEAIKRSRTQQDELNSALQTGVNLRQLALRSLLSTSETLDDVLAREREESRLMMERDTTQRFNQQGGFFGGGGGHAPVNIPTGGTGGGGGGDAFNTVGGVVMGIATKAGPWGIAIGALTGAMTIAKNVAEGLFGVFTTVAPVALSLVSEGFKFLISPITGLFGLIGSIKDGFGAFFGELGKGVLTLGLAYVGVQTLERAIKTLVETTIGFNANLEVNHTALALILKDQVNFTDRAADMQTEMQQVAINTTFGFEAVQRSVRGLMQGGISVGQILGDDGLLGVVLDVGASMGTLASGAIDHLTLALGQVQQAGHLTGEEMRQLRNAGVNLPEVFQVISQQTGITVAALTKMQTEGTLTAKMFFAGFKEWAKLNFGDLAKSQANTFSGAMQQIQEAITIVASRAFKPGFDLMSQALQNFAALVRGPEMLTFAAQLAGHFQGIIDGVMKVVDGFRFGFGFILDIVRSTGQLIYTALQWINPFARHSPSLVDSVEDGVQRIINSYARLGREVPSGIEPLANAMTGFRGTVSAGFDRIDQGIFAENAKSLAGFGAGAPEAYRAVQLAIRDLMDQAADLTPEIIAQTNVVRDLTDEQKEAKRTVDEWTLAVKVAKDEQRDMVDEIKAHRLEILQLNAQLLEAKQQYKDWQETLRPLQTDIDNLNIVLDTQNLELDRWQLALKIGEEGLIDLRTASTAATDHLSQLQDQLNLSKDALGGINDQLKMAKAGLKDILEVPLTGTNKYIDQIAAAQENIARIQAQIASRKVGGATEASLKGLNSQLSKAEAHLHLLEAKKKIDIDIPEAKLKRLTESGGVEIGFGDKEAQVKAAMALLTPLEQAQKLQQDRVDAQEALVRTAQQEAHAAKETVDTRNAGLDGLRHQVALAQQTRDHTELTRDALVNQLNIQKLQGHEFETNITLLDRQKTLAQEQLDIVQARLDLDTAERIQPLLDQQEQATRNYEDVNTRLGTANELLTNLKTAQGDLVGLAKSWQSEIDAALSKAKEFMSDQKRNAGGAGKFEGGDSDRTAGADAALERAKQQRLALARESALARGEMGEWIATWQEAVTQSVPWLGGFFGRLTGFLSGVSEAMHSAAAGDMPEFKRLFFETLQDVADGLPHQLNEWTAGFITWIDTTGIALGKKAFTILGDFLDWMFGKGATDINGGLSLWGDEFVEWIPPMSQQLFTDLQTEGTNLVNWIKAKAPEYKATLIGWKDEFVAWVKPIWEPLKDTLNTELIQPFFGWVGDQVPIISQWLLDNWVGPFVDWVFKGEKSLWGQMRPEMIKFINKIFDVIEGKDSEGGEDPLHRSGSSIAMQIATGFLDVVEVIAGTMANRLIGAVVRKIIENTPLLNMALTGPLDKDAIAKMQALAGPMDKMQLPGPADLGPGGIYSGQRGLPGNRAPESSLGSGPPLPGPGQLASMQILLQDSQLTNPAAAFEDGALYGENFQEGVKDELEIQSPSKVLHRIGMDVSAGFRSGIERGMEGFQNPFDPSGAYFSMGAGQKVRGGFSVTRQSPDEDPAYQKWLSLYGEQYGFGTTTASKESNQMVAQAGALWTSDTMPAKGDPYTDQRFQYPEKDKLPMGDTRDTSTHSYDYGSGDQANVTLILQNSTIVGKGGMEELTQTFVEGLARSARLRRLF